MLGFGREVSNGHGRPRPPVTGYGHLCPPGGRVYTGPMSNPSTEDRLESWKAIARYLGRSVRTVRRWEQQEGLPVHRLMHQSQASVYAFRQELDDIVLPSQGLKT